MGIWHCAHQFTVWLPADIDACVFGSGAGAPHRPNTSSGPAVIRLVLNSSVIMLSPLSKLPCRAAARGTVAAGVRAVRIEYPRTYHSSCISLLHRRLSIISNSSRLAMESRAPSDSKPYACMCSDQLQSYSRYDRRSRRDRMRMMRVPGLPLSSYTK